MKNSESPRCKSCNEIESLPHLLVNCPNIRDFWNSVLLWWNNQNNENYSSDELGIMYGYNPEIFSSHVLNYFILLAKRHAFLQKLVHKSPNISLFLELVKEKVIVERSISDSKGEEKKFKSFWKPLLSLIRV